MAAIGGLDSVVTKRRAERLTGYEIRPLTDNQLRVSYGAFCGDDCIATATHLIDELALEYLVRRVYQIHAVQALEKHGWRCARCRGGTRLEIHHRKYRSHGGKHTVDNLEPVCRDCHKVIHRLERSK